MFNKNKIVLLFLCLTLPFLFIQCGNSKNQITTPEPQGTHGTVKGYAKIKGASDNSGIFVYLETTQEGQTLSVKKALSSGKRVSPKEGISLNLSDVTDEEGYFEIDNVPVGTYTAVATKSNTLKAIQRNINVKSAPSYASVNFNLTPTGTIQGNVTITDETDYSNIFVYIQGTSYIGITDSSGTYSIYEVPSGTYTVTAAKNGYSSDTEGNITLSSAGQVVTVSQMNISKTLNYWPTINTVTAYPLKIKPNGRAKLTCLAQDMDEDTLTYSWETSAGTLCASGITSTTSNSDTTYWLSLSETGTFQIICKVGDGKDTATSYANILVYDDGTNYNIQIDVPNEYSTIQSAVDAAIEYDTVFVHNGTYNETVTISKNGLKLVGEDSSSTILSGNLWDSNAYLFGFYIAEKQDIRIENFNIQKFNTGIRIDTGISCYISNNYFYNHYYSCIYSEGKVDNTTIKSNLLYHFRNTSYTIGLNYSNGSENILIENNLLFDVQIFLYDVVSSIVFNNKIISINNDARVMLMNSNNIIVSNNSISNSVASLYPIQLTNSDTNNISNNQITNALLWGFSISGYDNTILYNNIFQDGSLGANINYSQQLFAAYNFSDKHYATASGFQNISNCTGIWPAIDYDADGDTDEADSTVYYIGYYGNNNPFVPQTNNKPTVSNLLVNSSTGSGQTISDATPTIGWTYSDADNDTQANYQVQVGSSDFSTISDSYAVYNPTADSYTVQTSLPNGTYYFRVRVSDDKEWSDFTSGSDWFIVSY